MENEAEEIGFDDVLAIEFLENKKSITENN